MLIIDAICNLDALCPRNILVYYSMTSQSIRRSTSRPVKTSFFVRYELRTLFSNTTVFMSFQYYTNNGRIVLKQSVSLITHPCLMLSSETMIVCEIIVYEH